MSSPIEITPALIRRLIAAQFPHWTTLPITPIQPGGNDNRTFRLGNDMTVRIPSASAYAAHVPIEQTWLPQLADFLPLPIPQPLALGQPEFGLPWQWLISNWLEGHAAVDRINDLPQFAADLAAFLRDLQSIDTDGAPPPGSHNFHRGSHPSVYDDDVRRCLQNLSDVINAPAAAALWNTALETTWTAAPVWIHGDVAPGNLLVSQGKLSAVIDFGQMAAGDPACDLTIAWTFFSGESRETFRRQLPLDDAVWSRARGWTLWKALLQLETHQHTHPAAASRALQVINEVLSEAGC